MKKQYLFLILSILFVSPLFVSAEVFPAKAVASSCGNGIDVTWAEMKGARLYWLARNDVYEDFAKDQYDLSLSVGMNTKFNDKNVEAGTKQYYKIWYNDQNDKWSGGNIFSAVAPKDCNSEQERDYDVVGPKGTQYIGDGNIEMNWNKDFVVDTITLQNYKENDLLVVHAWKVRSDYPITDGHYSLSDAYKGYEWRLEQVMKDGQEYRLHLTGPDGVDFYSDWFVVYHGKSYSNTTYSKLNLSVTPDYVVEGNGNEIVVRFNDIGTDYYMVGASCKSGVSVSIEGKDKDLCYGREKIYGGGKDVIKVDGLYPSSNRDASFNIEVEAIVGGDVVKVESETVDIEFDEARSDWEKYGDIRFINPKEGQRTPEELKAGQSYTLKWENIVIKTEWPDVHLYKYNSKPSSDYLRNGPTNVSIGTQILDLGTAYIGQEDMIINLPSDLEPGYYYFKFGGKAAGDSSPAIEIIEKSNPSGRNMSDEETLSLFSNLFGQDSELFKIISLLIELGII